MDDLSSRFLDGFSAIENWMRHTLSTDDKEDFNSLVRRMGGRVRRHSLELKSFARLRNLIAHNHSHEMPLAVPTLASVERIEVVGKLLMCPPLLITVAAKPVEECRPSDPLGRCVKKMHDGIFSQLPIYEAGQYCGLLTAETIARWLAASFLGDGSGIVDEQTVDEVIKHQESSENVEFVAKTAHVGQALAAFDRFLHSGRRLEAILITERGRPTESPLGIVTIHDIPKLNNAINA